MLRIGIILIIFTVFGIYQDQKQENEPLKGPDVQTLEDKDDQLDQSTETPPGERPKTGLSVYIGKNVSEIKKEFGEPDRIDDSAFNYDWWVYNVPDTEYIQFGVRDKKVVSLYAIGNGLDVAPYKLGQKLEDIYRFTIVDSEIVVKSDSGSYQFELNEEDLNTRLLVPLGDLYAQLYLDKFTGELSSIRFMDSETLVAMHPYEMMYRGELAEEVPPSEEEWADVNEANEKQIYAITNIMRKQYGESTLQWDETTANAARGHSREMHDKNYFSHESDAMGSLQDRLDKLGVPYQTAGENIASQYLDGPEAVHGWLNSDGHRKILLDKAFTHIGVGVYKGYYTQNFIKKPDLP
ncbi:CAP domain-containing protein [Rossellomorea sp. RS05]|uniref:CAP domain-containing protein n=1 Tax=Rossellomorea sp. RS05 TaxID=3149166 RepID=UPI003221D418